MKKIKKNQFIRFAGSDYKKGERVINKGQVIQPSHIMAFKSLGIKNLLVKKNLNYLLRNFKKALESGDKTKTQELSKKLIKSFDKAAQKNVIHKNASARKKSGVMKRISKK